MKSPAQSAPSVLEHKPLLVLLVAVSLALAWILQPFFSPLLWSAIIALLFAPLHRRLQLHLRHRRTLAALLTILIAAAVVVVPVALLSAMLAYEAAGFLTRMQSGESGVLPNLRWVFDALPSWVTALLKPFGLADFDAVQRHLNTRFEQASGFIAARVISLGQSMFEFSASLLITPYLAFFLILDGERIVHAMRRALPLTPAHKQELLHKFSNVIRSTVKGNLVVAGIQGALGGLAFWFLVTGATWQGVALVAWGVLVIGLVDNLLRPMLVGKATVMPDYVVMITTLGGMVVFGINGFVLGPVIAAMFFALWHLYGDTRQGDAPATSGEGVDAPS
jgi:predicted PurR-regulated permease PerM